MTEDFGKGKLIKLVVMVLERYAHGGIDSNQRWGERGKKKNRDNQKTDYCTCNPCAFI